MFHEMRRKLGLAVMPKCCREKLAAAYFRDKEAQFEKLLTELLAARSSGDVSGEDQAMAGLEAIGVMVEFQNE